MANRGDGVMDTKIRNREGERIFDVGANPNSHPKLDLYLNVCITDVTTSAKTGGDPTSNMAELEAMPDSAAVRPLRPTDVQPGRNDKALVAGMIFYDYCRDVQSLAAVAMTMQRSAALTSTRPARPSRA